MQGFRVTAKFTPGKGVYPPLVLINSENYHQDYHHDTSPIPGILFWPLATKSQLSEAALLDPGGGGDGVLRRNIWSDFNNSLI